MKVFKNLFMLLSIALLTTLLSCDNQDSETTPQEEQGTAHATSRLRFVNSDDYDTSGMNAWEEVSTVPDAIQSYISENYTDVMLEEIWMTTTGEYIVLLDDDTVLIFNASEQFIIAFNLDGYVDDFEDDFEEVDIANLPQTILDYLVANHADDTVDIAGLNATECEYVIVLDSGMILIFDTEGNFIEAFEDDDYEDDLEEIDVADLPQAILDYLTANHAEATIEEAFIDREEDEYVIVLDSDLIVIFDLAGNFIEAFEDDYEDHCDEVDVADLPQAISDYVSTNYNDITIEEARFDEETNEYFIELSNELVLVFDGEGVFLREYTDDEDDEDNDEDNDDEDDGE